MYLKRSKILKYFLTTIFGAAFYGEWLLYYIQPFYWQSHECFEYDNTCTKILFIADPQINGDTAVSPPFSYILNWDSDRYLRLTFNAVLKHFKPDVLIFLGDLMNEGSIASPIQFESYMKRLSKIFHTDQKLLRVYVPGENDVGSDSHSAYSYQLMQFEKAYAPQKVVRFRNITFYKVNVITGIYPKKTDIDDNLKIILSHYPVLVRHQFSLNVENTLHPDIFFCGHEHESKYMVQTHDRTQKDITWFYYPRNILDMVFREGLMYEVYVPTCSYTMGISYMGYGAAVVENDNHNMRYTVFWSFSRFPYLILYLVVVILLLVYCLVYCLGRCNRNRNNKASDKMSLLSKM